MPAQPLITNFIGIASSRSTHGLRKEATSGGKAVGRLPSVPEEQPGVPHDGQGGSFPAAAPQLVKHGGRKPAAAKTGRAAAAAVTSSTAGHTAADSASETAANAAGSIGCGSGSMEALPINELALRFNCAAQVLQLLGLIREAPRRRRESCVQRLVFPMHGQAEN